MIINEILYKKNMSMYALSKKSGVPNTTIRNICSGKTTLRKCSVDSLYKISKALDVTIEDLIEGEDKLNTIDYDTFRSNTQHKLKRMGDYAYIKDVLTSDVIQDLFDKKKYAESLYILALLDYLSRIHNIPICGKYNQLRTCKLQNPLYPRSVIAADVVNRSKHVKQKAIADSIPEFIRFNIVECEVRNVV